MGCTFFGIGTAFGLVQILSHIWSDIATNCREGQSQMMSQKKHGLMKPFPAHSALVTTELVIDNSFFACQVTLIADIH